MANDNIVALSKLDLHSFQSASLVIVATTDIHWNLPAIMRIGTFIIKLRQQNRNVLVFDSGDSISSVANGLLSVRFLNRIGYDAMAMGNHEFDLGLNSLKSCIMELGGKFLNDNIRFPENVQTGDLLFEPYKIINAGPYRTLVTSIGAAKLEVGQEPDFEIMFTPGSEVIERIKRILADNRENYDFSILLSHLGTNEDQQICSDLDFNLVLSGHNHVPTFTPVQIGKSMLTNPGGEGKYFSILTVDADLKIEHQLIKVDYESPVIYDMKVIQESFTFSQGSGWIIGKSAYDFLGDKYSPQSPLGQLVSYIVWQETDADVVLLNASNINNVIPAGPITRRDLNLAVYFNDKLMSAEFPGRYLRDVFFHALSRAQFDPYYTLFIQGLSRGSETSELLIGGASLDIDGVYRVVVPKYLLDGGLDRTYVNHLSKTSFKPVGKRVRDLVEEQIRKMKVLKPHKPAL